MSLDLEREEVVQTLCAHYAQDHLTTGELEARFEQVYRAPDRAALFTVLDGLPAIKRPAPPSPLGELRPSAPPLLYEPPRQVTGLRDAEKRYLAIFSEVKKEGAWRAPSFAKVRAIMGGVVLDLREADIPPDGMEIDAECIMGEVRILLPLGVGAEVDCTAILGEVVDRTQQGTPGLPVVRVRGGTTMGAIRVETKLPKKAKLESWRDEVRGWLGGGN
jgi:hypothetical protein